EWTCPVTSLTTSSLNSGARVRRLPTDWASRGEITHLIGCPCAGSGELFEEGPCLLQVRRIEPLGEPAVALGQHRACFGRATLLLVQAGQAHRGPQLQRFGLLLSGDGEGLAETGFRLAARDFGPPLPQQELAPQAMQLGPVEAFSGAVHQSQS